MSEKSLHLLAGLGNPGDIYKYTRHNAGFMAIDNIADFYSIKLNNSKFDVTFGSGLIEGVKVILAKPMAYMNRSGPPIFALSNYFKISINNILVIHDDIDLRFGRIKIKKKGGSGGHNGIKSLIDAFDCGDFARLRIGVGRPEAHFEVVDHVLSKFSSGEKKNLKQVITRATDAAVTIICNGIDVGINRFN